MALPVAKAAAEDLRQAHRELLRVVDSLSEADWERGVPYGEWTVRDLVAHAIGDMSPSGPGLILAGVLTPQFIADTSRQFDVRVRNQAMVEERSRLTREDLRQLLFDAHHARIAAMLKLDESHLPVLQYAVPMGPEYDLRVEDWLWYGYHDRQHADDIRRALSVDYRPRKRDFTPAIEEKLRLITRAHDGCLRAVYSVAEDAWQETSASCPGWTYHDILAHLASNEARLQVRLRSAIGEASAGELAAVNEIDSWNRERVEERRGRPLPDLIDEFLAARDDTLAVISKFRPEDEQRKVRLADGSQVPVLEFIERIARHNSIHAGHLVPASRARRSA